MLGDSFFCIFQARNWIICVLCCQLERQIITVFSGMGVLSTHDKVTILSRMVLSARDEIAIFASMVRSCDKIFATKATDRLPVVFCFGFYLIKSLFKPIGGIFCLQNFRLIVISRIPALPRSRSRMAILRDPVIMVEPSDLPQMVVYLFVLIILSMVAV
jgi:hypothetical protein